MGFLKPLFLIGWSLAAIPIILHLLHRRRLKRVDFSSLFFLRDIKRERFSWLRLQELLLLLARTLLIFFLIFALARPYFQSSVFLGKRKASVAIIIDDSYSMDYRRNVSSFEHAQVEARSLIGQLAAGSEVCLILSSQVDKTAKPSRNLKAILTEIDSLRVSYKALELKGAIEEALAALETASLGVREVFVFTDLQRRALLPLLSLPLPKGVQFYIVDVGDKEAENTGVVGIKLENPLPSPQEPTKISAEIKNYSDKEITTRVRLMVNNEILERGEKLRPKEEKKVTFDKTLSGPGSYSGFVEIDRDSLTADDRSYFAFTIPEKIPVLLVYEKPEDIFYLRTALAPMSGSIFNLETSELTNLKRVELGRFKVVALINPIHLTMNDWQRIARYLDQGGGVFVDLGERVADESWLSLFGENQATYRPQGFLSLEEIDYRHPIFEVFQGNLDPTIPKFFRIVKIDPLNSKVLARFSDGSPFFIEANNQRLIIATTAFDLNSTDLPFKTMFLPLVHRTFVYLAQPFLESNYSVGDTLVLPVSQSGPVTVITPEQTSRVLPVMADNRRVIQFDKTEVPGIYRLAENIFSVNALVDEGNLSRVRESEIKRAGLQLLTSVRAHRVDLTQALLYLSLFLLIVEMLLIVAPRLPASFSKLSRFWRKT